MGTFFQISKLSMKISSAMIVIFQDLRNNIQYYNGVSFSVNFPLAIFLWDNLSQPPTKYHEDTKKDKLKKYHKLELSVNLLLESGKNFHKLQSYKLDLKNIKGQVTMTVLKSLFCVGGRKVYPPEQVMEKCVFPSPFIICLINSCKTLY